MKMRFPAHMLLPALIALTLAGTEARSQVDFRTLGDPDAPLQMTVYSDFECPFCRNFALAVFPALKAEFIDTGILRFRYVFFPLASIHPNAVAASMAAYCAGVAGRFWAYHDYLYVRQPEWRGEAAPDSIWTAFAVRLGIDVDSFDTCRTSRVAQDAVEKDWSEAMSAGATGTPTIVLEGESLADFETYDELSLRIREALAAARREGS